MSTNKHLWKLYNESTRFKLEIAQENARTKSTINKVFGCWKKDSDTVKEYPDALKGHPDAFIFQLQKRRTERWKIYKI